MERTTRRDALKAALIGVAAVPVAPASAAPRPHTATQSPTDIRWGVGVEGQRRADLGNGTYRNPIVPGDHPDPTILKDGEDYYMTFSSFTSYPGLVIWHSKDLVNWSPIGPALKKPIGSVWAPDLAKCNGRYFIYIPAVADNGNSTYVIYADNIRGPWSDPIDLKVPGCIDPGHAVGEDGKRYLFFNGVRRIRLTDDGLATDGALEHVYDPWQYPADWVVEMFAAEGPKVLRHKEWFYLIAAVGGTSGPATGHMVIAARSKSIHGPWEHCPHNPLVHTKSDSEPWWSRGHATVVEGPAGDWWMVYHGYENGYRTLGRQPLLDPVEWTADGWFRTKGGTLAAPLKKPSSGKSSPSGFALSDDFSANRLGLQWSFYAPSQSETERIRYENNSLVMRAKGTTPGDCSPLTMIVGNRSYEASVCLEATGGAQGGLALFYNDRAFVGIGYDGKQIYSYNFSQEHPWIRIPLEASRIHFKVTNHENIVAFYYSTDGKTWTKHPWQMEVSGYHQNVFGGFVSLRIALFSHGQGEVRARDFTYRGLDR